MTIPEKIKIRNGLKAFAKKIGKQPLTIAYLGASNTALEVGWRPVVQKWINKTFNPKGRHTEINASIGGTDSLTGAFISSDIIREKKPDLVFIEYSQPDINTFYKKQELLLAGNI